MCTNSESDRSGACFVLWATNNETGEAHVQMKGCFTGNSCSNTECIDNGSKRKMNFCCCTGHMCNTNYKSEPTTAAPPKVKENAMYPEPVEEPNFLLVIGIGCGIAFVVAILFLIAFLYRNKKNALFNEIPTVCISTTKSFTISYAGGKSN